MVFKARAKTETSSNSKFFDEAVGKGFEINGRTVNKEELLELAKLGRPIRTYHMTYEMYQGSIERFYFWLVDQLRWDMRYKVSKLEDSFTSSITSSFWGSIEQRRSTQQEKVSQYLGLIANMVKSLFQILRSLRIMEERWQYYVDSRKGDKSAEIALKGLWVDLVEGGGKNPASVYALATQVGFVTLPDLFFDLTPKTKDDVDKLVESVDINKKVKEVLKRKLKQFMLWKEATEKEIKTSKIFHLKYLRQHFNTIRLYMSWIKPYLKNIRKLEQKGKRDEDILEIADIATSDIEIFATKDRVYAMGTNVISQQEHNYPHEYLFKKYFPVIRLLFEYRTVPELAYHQEYQRGAVHMGHNSMKFEAYALTRDQIEAYIKSKEIEDIDLLGDINSAMIALKDDLLKYLNEADEIDAEEKLGLKKESKKATNAFSALFGRMNILKPFEDVLTGFKNLFGPLARAPKGKVRQKRDTKIDENEKKIATKLVRAELWGIYDVFKKAHGLVRW